MIESFLVLTAWLPLPAVPQEPIEAEATAAATPMEQYSALRTEYDQAMQAFWKEFQEQPEDQQEAFYAKRPSAEEYVPRFLELAEAHAKTEAAASSLLWVAQYSQDSRNVSKALDTLIVDHLDSPSLGQACGLLMRKYDVGEKYLTEILEQSSNPDVQGNACYYLGKHYMSCADLTGTLSEATAEQRQAYVGYLGGEEVVARIAAMDPAELQKQAEACFERVSADFPDVVFRRSSTLGRAAGNDLFQLRSLQIGMLAPDIAGEDIFGTEFKISDYRGKVVVLDFWGNW